MQGVGSVAADQGVARIQVRSEEAQGAFVPLGEERRQKIGEQFDGVAGRGGSEALQPGAALEGGGGLDFNGRPDGLEMDFPLPA